MDLSDFKLKTLTSLQKETIAVFHGWLLDCKLNNIHSLELKDKGKLLIDYGLLHNLSVIYFYNEYTYKETHMLNKLRDFYINRDKLITS